MTRRLINEKHPVRPNQWKGRRRRDPQTRSRRPPQQPALRTLNLASPALEGTGRAFANSLQKETSMN